MAEVDTSFYPKANPNAFFDTANSAIGFANSAQQNRLLGTQNQQAQQDLRSQQLGILRSALGAIAANPNASYQDFAGLGSLVEQGLVSPDFYQSEMAKVPQQAPPDVYRQIANKYNAQLASVGERYAMETGIPLGQANLPTSFTNAQGQNVPTTFGQYPADIGLGNGQPAPMQPGANQLMSTPQPLGGGSQGGNMLVPNEYGLGAGMAPFGMNDAANGQADRVMGPAPGQVEAMQAAGQEAGQELAAARAREANFARDIVPLQKAIPALEALGTTGTGPGTEQINEIKSFLTSMGIPGIDVENIKNFDEARKYLSQYAQSVGDTNTNDKLAAAFAANPSVGISNAAAVDVAKTALAQRRFQNAQLRAFEASGGSPDQYTQFATQFSAAQDPRAYGSDMMSPSAREKLYSSLQGDSEAKRAERAKFVQSLKTAIALGLVQPPQ